MEIKKWFSFVLIFISLKFLFIGCAGKSPIEPNPPRDELSLKVSFIDLRGSIGDATLISLSNGKTILIDAGDWNQGRQYVVPYISGEQIRRLNFVIATHYHADHIGGIPVVCSNFEVDSVLDRGYSYETYTTYYSAVRSKRREVNLGDTLWLANKAFITCVAVNGNGSISDPTNTNYENDLSAAFHIKFGKFDLFVGGDLTGGGNRTYDIESIIATDIGKLEAYKVNHHGSSTSSNQYFLSIVRPKVSIISVGNYNGLPSDEVCNRLRGYGDLFITKNDGNVVIFVSSTQSDSFELRTSKTNIQRFYRCHPD